MAKPITVFGDSNSVEHGVSPGQGWPALLAAELCVTKTVVGSSGHMAADQAWLLYGVSPVVDRDYLISLGTNDAQHYGPNATRIAAYAAFLRAIAVWCGAPVKYTARTGGIAFTGTWSDTPVNGIGRMTTNSGATATKTVNGTAAYVAVIIQNHAVSQSVFEVYIDGVLADTISLSGVVIGNTLTGRSYAPACFRFGGLSNGPHVVQVKSISGNTLFLEWIAGADQPAKPGVFIADVVKRTSVGYASSGNNDANVAAYGAAAFAMVDELATDGLDVTKVPIHAVFNPAIHLQPDGIHYNVPGHPVVKGAFLDAIEGTVEPPEHMFSPVACYMRDDGKFFIGEGDNRKEISVI